MNIICNKNQLAKGAGIVSRAVSGKTTLPILECILLDASSGEFTLIGNDLDMGIKTVLDANIKEQGTIAVNAKIFNEIIRKLPDEDVSIETVSPKILGPRMLPSNCWRAMMKMIK